MKSLCKFLIFLDCLLCFQIQLNYATEDWKRVYLATYPRSGNHWIRFLIKEATNIVTSSVYKDQAEGYQHLPNPFPWGGYACYHGYEGNRMYPKKGSTVIIKTHFPVFPKEPFDSASYFQTIRIVRHPLASFYSFYIYACACDNCAPEQKVPSSFVKECICNWQAFQKYWNDQPNVTTFLYEKLYNDPYNVFSEILSASGYSVEPEDVIRAIEKFPPKGHILKYLEKFNTEDLKEISAELQDLMQQFGYTIPLVGKNKKDYLQISFKINIK